MISLIVIEFSLRLAGYFYYTFHMQQEADKTGHAIVDDRVKVSPADARLVKILCIGDSWTFGTGAGAGYSYPAKLQVILDKENPHRYRIYNAGVPGCTSGKLLSYLPNFLKKYHPKITIILIGSNDVTNYSASEIVYLSSWPRKFYFTLTSAISDLRVYKLIRLGLDGLAERSRAFRKHPAYVDADTRSRSAQWCEAGYDLYIAGKFDLGEAYLKKAIDIDPSNERAYMQLGHLYQVIQRYDKSLIFFEKLLEINPHTSLRTEVYRFLFSMYQDQGYPQDIRNKIFYLIKKIPSDGVFKNPGAPFILNNGLTTRNLENNLTKIIDLIRANNAMPILLTYIYRGIPSPLNGVMINLSEKHGILLVDNAKNLVRLSDIDSYFAPDNHPNEKGYRFIAENIYKALKMNENENHKDYINNS